MAKVPARYIGEHDVLLSKYGAPYQDGDGLPLTTLLLHQGDTLMVPDEELYGVTWLFDPRSVNDPVKIGVGRQAKPEHARLSDAALYDLGYRYHTGRADFEPYSKDVLTSGQVVPDNSTQPLQPLQNEGGA